MSDHSITSLIEKLEGVDVGSRELDAAIFQFDPKRAATGYWFADEKPGANPVADHVPAVTTSLDAALALAERLGLQAGDILHKAWRAMAKKHALHMRFYTGKNYASEAALCACAAILRAQSEARV